MAALAVAAAAALAAGCGQSSKHASSSNGQTVQRSTTAPTETDRSGGSRHNPVAKSSSGITIRLPRHWAASHGVVSPKTWPRPLAVAASFPIHHLGANAACSKEVLASIPPDGVFILVSEYTKPAPPGYPPITAFGRRGDLRHLDIRPSEVECWEGLSGAAHFVDHGRDFYVEVLLGKRITAAQRRHALEALATLRVTRGRS